MAEQSQQRRQENSNSEFEEKILHINRCSKVVKGGRKFSFSALILIGNGRGSIGYGFAKANEVSEAIRKGGAAARNNILHFNMDGTTIPHAISVKWDGAEVMLKPAPQGTGLVAGSKLRAVLELGGLRDVVAKSRGSNNPLNVVRAAVRALSGLRNREETMANRGIV
jgi:small subunit ribosomal protein S5